MQAALRKQFQPVTSAERASESLLELQQQPNQNVSEFASVFRSLLAKADEALRLPAMQSLLAQRFTKGLRDPDIKRDLQKEDPKTLERAIELATRLDGRGGGSSSAVALAAAEANGDLVAQLAALNAEMQQLRKGTVQGQQPPSVNQPRWDSRANRGAMQQDAFG